MRNGPHNPQCERFYVMGSAFRKVDASYQGGGVSWSHMIARCLQMQFNFLVNLVQGGASWSRSRLSKRCFSHFLASPKHLSLSEISTLPPALALTLQKICLRGASDFTTLILGTGQKIMGIPVTPVILRK